MKSAVSLAREFTKTGMERAAAEAVAEAIVTHVGKSRATKAELKMGLSELKGDLKADIAELRGELKTLVALTKINLALTAGLYVPLAVVFFGGGV